MFDDVDDYHGWSASPPQTKDGTPLADYAEWTRSVVIDFVDPSNPSAVVGTDMGLTRITVTLTKGGGVQATLVALRSNVGAFEQEPGGEQTYVSWIGCDLQVGGAAAKQIPLGAALPNEPQGP
jgi:hypothetical protein